jgi:hypothetical protein
MAVDATQSATGVTTTASLRPTLKNYLSSWNVAETAGSTAVVKIRDSLALPTAIASAADGAAGNSTTGLHMYLVTWVTPNGESTYGRNAADRLEHTTAGSKIVGLTGIPIAPINADGRHSALGTPIVGRRLYATKAGAPATGVTPTNAQWFLVLADLSTTLTSAMNNITLPQTSLTVAATSGFAAAGNILVASANGPQVVSYTSVDATHFLGCTGGTGTMATSGAVTQPVIGDNTSTTYSLSIADGSFASTQPPIMDTAGRRVRRIRLAANEAVGEALGENVIGAANDGGFSVEVTSGTVDWTLAGK